MGMDQLALILHLDQKVHLKVLEVSLQLWLPSMVQPSFRKGLEVLWFLLIFEFMWLFQVVLEG